MGDKGTALTSPLQPGVSTVGDRVQGFLDEMKANHPSITIVYLGSSTSSDSAVASFNAAFVAHPDVNGIFAVANLVSEAATTAIKGLPASRQEGMKIIGFDAGPTAVDALKAGQIQGLIAQKPAQMGALAVDNALKSLQGKSVDRSIPTDGVGLTQSNISNPDYAQYIYKSSC